MASLSIRNSQLRDKVHLCTDVARSWLRVAADKLQSVSWQTTQDLHHTDGISTLPFISTHCHTQTCKQTDEHTQLPPNDEDQVVRRKSWTFNVVPISSRVCTVSLLCQSREVLSLASRKDINTLSSLMFWVRETSGALEGEAMGAMEDNTVDW